MALVSVLFFVSVVLAFAGLFFHEVGSPAGRVMAVICLVAVGLCAWQFTAANRAIGMKAVIEGSAFIIVAHIAAVILRWFLFRLVVWTAESEEEKTS